MEPFCYPRPTVQLRRQLTIRWEQILMGYGHHASYIHVMARTLNQNNCLATLQASFLAHLNTPNLVQPLVAWMGYSNYLFPHSPDRQMHLFTRHPTQYISLFDICHEHIIPTPHSPIMAEHLNPIPLVRRRNASSSRWIFNRRRHIWPVYCKQRRQPASGWPSRSTG